MSQYFFQRHITSPGVCVRAGTTGAVWYGFRCSMADAMVAPRWLYLSGCAIITAAAAAAADLSPDLSLILSLSLVLDRSIQFALIGC